ncbi:MAG TPA: hypothetical protein VH257_15160, partial [Chloroflexota bacterium]|nr:hypothetical protein [Chloroflexota bacterium]
LSIQEWRHRTVMGRDQDVRVVVRGYLLPFGHPATVVALSERKLGATPNGTPAQAAYLRERLFLVLRQPTKAYPSFGQRSGGRRFPFRRLTVANPATPTLDGRAPFGGVDGAFVPRVGGAPFEFHFVAEDLLGRRSEFAAPAVFVDSATAYSESAVAPVRTAYNALAESDALRRRPFDGQPLALAESETPGETDAEASALTFGVDEPVAGPPDAAFAAQDQPRFYPGLSGAAIRLVAAEQLAGAGLGPVQVVLDGTYVAHGFDPGQNPGQVYATLVQAVGLGLDADRAGPLTPAMNVTALSRTMGPVGGDLGTLKQGRYDAAEIFRQAPTVPRLMGGVKLSDIIGEVPLTADRAPDEAMVLRTAAPLGPSGSGARAGGPEQVGNTNRFTWRPKLKGDPLGFLKFYDYTFCQVDLEIRVDFGGSDGPHTRFSGLISNGKPWSLISDLPDNTDPGPMIPHRPGLTLRLLGNAATFLEVDFVRFLFRTETGKDAVIDPVIDDVRFLGPLKAIQEFRESLKSLTPPGAPKLGFIIRPVGTCLEVGLKVGELSASLGMCTVKNLMVGFTITFPIIFSAAGTDPPRPVRFSFYFAERENPFLLAVYIFGGGGYFVTGFACDGMEWFEVGLEFGLHAEANIGVASGVLEMMAGIYWRLDVGPHSEQNCVLTGFFRARGQVSVIGLVTITLEVYLGLTYQSQGNLI